MPNMLSVFSSHVNRIGYNAETNELHVEWDSGKTSVYSGVPAGVADGVMRSWSVGTALHNEVKDKYEHRYA